MSAAFEYGLEAFLREFRGPARVGLVTNASGCDRRKKHVAERLTEVPHLDLKVIFTPEHGFGADEPDGEPVSDSHHPRLQVPIVSLYGPKKIPAPQDLDGLDALIYDIQDVGVRFYTYISTLRNILEAASGKGIPVHILDRPDLLGGEVLEGPFLHPDFASFVGHLPVPLRYGLTPGELALWLKRRLALTCEVIVWKCAGWRRGMAFADWNVPWKNLSPSMISPDTAKFYPGTCLFEGTNVAEGRGTGSPFQTFGAPWVRAADWHAAAAARLPKHVQVAVTGFVPTFSKFAGESCQGIIVTSALPVLPDAVLIGFHLLETLLQTHPGQIEFARRSPWPHPFFDHLAGNSWLREGLQAGAPAGELYQRAQKELAPFAAERREFLQYDERTQGTG